MSKNISFVVVLSICPVDFCSSLKTKKTMKKLALFLSLSLSVLNTGFAATASQINVNSYVKYVSDDEISNYVLIQFKERVIRIDSIDGSENVLAYTASGKVYLLTIVDSIIITGTEEPNL
jgi:hypothetical protein